MLGAKIEQMNPAGTEPHTPLTEKALRGSSTIWNEVTGASRVPKLPRTHWAPYCSRWQVPIESRASPALLCQHGLRVPQVAQLEALGERGDQRPEECLGLGAAPLDHPQPRQARGRTQLVEERVEASRHLERPSVAGFCLGAGRLRVASPQEQVATGHVE